MGPSSGARQSQPPAEVSAPVLKRGTGASSTTRSPREHREHHERPCSRLVGVVAAGVRQEMANQEEQPEALPDGWRILTDKAAGTDYFWNTKTGETTWTRPTQAV